MLQRVGALSGLIAIGLLGWSSALFSGSHSSPEDPDAAVIAELIESGSDAGLSTRIAMFAVPFLAAFGGFVADRFRRHGLPGWVGSTFLTGSILLGVSAMLIGGVGLMASMVGEIPGAAGVARLVVVFGWNSTLLFIPAILAMGTMAVIATIEASALPRVIGYSGVIVAVSALAPWVGVVVLAAWLAVTSLVLTLEEPAVDTVERRTTAV